jgi:transcriptional regulator with XRE-family HTH domain
MSRPESSRPTLHDLIGARLKARRIVLGLSQHEVAQRVGITYQQLHKYETGLNRISASRLYCCAEALEMPIDFFFRDPEVEAESPAPSRRRQLLSFSRAFNDIAESHIRDAVAELARVLALPIEPEAQATEAPRQAAQPATAGICEPVSAITGPPPARPFT